MKETDKKIYDFKSDVLFKYSKVMFFLNIH